MGEGWHFILQLLQLFHKIIRDQIAPGTQDLSKFDIGGPHLFQGQTHPLPTAELQHRILRPF